MTKQETAALKEQMKAEYVKCYESPYHFINTYVKVVHPHKGVVPFALYEFQTQTLQNFAENKNNIVLKSRQMGISTLVAAYCLWLMLFHKNKNILIVSLRQDDARDVVEKVRFANESLPPWLKAKCIEDNRLSMVFENGSEIKASSTTKKTGVGQALSLLVIDEAALIDSAEELWTSAQPALSLGGDAIVLSTPRGVGNWFHKMWTEAETGENGFVPIKLPWHLHPERNQEWRNIEGKKLGDPRKAAQEFDCDFLASGNTLVAGEIIIKHRNVCVEPSVKKNNGLWMFVEPIPDHKYFVCSDVASGYSTDLSAFHVLDLSTPKLEQVCSYRGKISPTEYAGMLMGISVEYNSAPLLVERSGLGVAVTEQINVLEYPNLVYTNPDLSEIVLKFDVQSDKLLPGFSTNVRTRPLALDRLEEYLRQEMIIIRDQRLMDELLTFVEKNGKYQAVSGFTDDMVMGLAIGLRTLDGLRRYTTRNVDNVKKMLDGMSKTGGKVESKSSSTMPSVYSSGENRGQKAWTMNVKGNEEDLKWLL